MTVNNYSDVCCELIILLPRPLIIVIIVDFHMIILWSLNNGILFIIGVIDNSGMRFYYTSTRREHDAGLLALGNSVPGLMIIPPNATNYTIAGLCTSKCTKEV